MSESVIVVQDRTTGKWNADCLDTRCGGGAGTGAHLLAYQASKPAADAAATRHRKYVRTLPRDDGRMRSDACPECGHSPRSVKDLQELVAQLEARLSAYENDDSRPP